VVVDVRRPIKSYVFVVTAPVASVTFSNWPMPSLSYVVSRDGAPTGTSSTARTTSRMSV
jgi:hypothetical protein